MGLLLLLLPAMATALEKRVQRLEGHKSPIATGGLGAWGGSDWADFDLIADASSVLQWCSFDQFVIGRACWAAWKYCKPILDNYRYWSRHTEPDWYSNAAYLSKPGSAEAIAKERAKYPPSTALESFASFARWAYTGDGGLADHVAIAAAVWLIDVLGMAPELVTSNGLAHVRAWKFGYESLARVEVPEAVAYDSPTIPLSGLPVPAVWDEWLKTGSPIEVVSMLLCVKSGIKAPHGRWLYPTVEQ